MTVTDRRGQPLPDNHPLKGARIVFGQHKPAPPPAIQHFGPPPLPEWEGPVEVVFSLAEESSDGGNSYCWIERRGDEFILFGNELGQMSDSCSDPISALTSEGTEFGMDRVEIKSALPLDEFLQACSGIILSNVSQLIVNGVEVDARDLDGIAAKYKAMRSAPLTKDNK